LKEENKVTVALDAMGGDYAPSETVKGAVQAACVDEDLVIKLFGDRAKIEEELARYNYDTGRIIIEEAATVIENTEHPVEAIKKKRDSSMVKALYSVRNGEADACVSCGNTGALLVGGQVIVGKLKGVERCGLAFIVPSKKGPVMIIDCGASVDSRPAMLVQFAQMASVYMKDVMGTENPRVGIVNIGEEEEKGNQLVQETIPLLKECTSINYIGSVESRGITEGMADVVVCDAFVGNIILKMYEGVASFILKAVKEALTSDLKTKLGALMIKKSLKESMKTFSIEEYGGSPMLGLKHPVFKTHGSSKSAEIRNTILQCRAFVQNNVCSQIGEFMR